ncbi:Transcriptional regulator of ribosomal biogenesis protein [Mortierella alpina]|uniref:Transcriptional regulator of ribosomal biogenesis protein n=1 Tax=Mortierella alpina TaxID=64518 RepID=A0A9P6J8J8_MORAP|nr:Transcriptional regulator of ribosomal biogenesis protein [Mortierella alpina]
MIGSPLGSITTLIFGGGLNTPILLLRFDNDFGPESSTRVAALETSPAREFETAYCRDFYCCGLTLLDLHDLLQHCEECHVHFEEDDLDTDNEAEEDDDHEMMTINSTTHALEAFSATFGASAKRKAVVSMSDIYSAGDEDGPPAHPAMRVNNSVQRPSTPAADSLGPMIKRHHATGASSSLPGKSWNELQTGQAYTPHPLSASSVGPYFGNMGHPTTPSYFGRAPTFLQGTPASACAWPSSSTSPVPITSLADLIRQRDEIFNIIDDLTRLPQNASGENKPYRCAVPGCDKAYKNPNGLKYHNLHGHSSSSSSSTSTSSATSSSGAGSGDATGTGDGGEGMENKPYVCTFLECGKRYKNLNGLKYHIEHTHPNFMAALRAHQSGLINHPLLLQLAPLKEHHHDVMITLAAALAAVEASPVMAMAANAVLQSAATSAANHFHSHGHGHSHGPTAAAVHTSVSFGPGNAGGSDPRSGKSACTSSETGSSLPPARGPHPPESAAGHGSVTSFLNNCHPTVLIAPATLTSSNKK